MSEKKDEKKERKVKIVYYDDGSTVADMQGTRKDKTPRQKVPFSLDTGFAFSRIRSISSLLLRF